MLNRVTDFVEVVDSVKKLEVSIAAAINGHLSPDLLSPTLVQQVLSSVESTLRSSRTDLDLVHKTAADMYASSDTYVWCNDSTDRVHNVVVYTFAI